MNNVGVEIPCSFVPVKKSYFGESEDYKFGRYSQSTFGFKDFGTKKWVVITYLKLDYEKWRTEGLNDEEIVQGCANFLSRKQRISKRKEIQVYGNLEPVKIADKVSFKKKEKDIFVVEFATDHRKNNNFWGQGLAQDGSKPISKRGRPPKNKNGRK